MAETLSPDAGIIDQFKDQARKFWTIYRGMENDKEFMSRQTPALQAEYSSLMDRGSILRRSIETFTSIIDSVSSAYGSVKEYFGFDGINNNLGIIPLIPIAGITAALALIGKWVNDAYMFNQRLNEVKRLEAQGISPTRAHAIVEKTMPRGILGNIGSFITPLLLLGGVAILFKLRKKR